MTKMGSVQVKQLMSSKKRKKRVPKYQNQGIYLKDSIQD